MTASTAAVKLAEQVVDLADRVEVLTQEIERLRLGYCDEAYILWMQALDVKALSTSRRRVLTEQAIRMAQIGLSEGQARYPLAVHALQGSWWLGASGRARAVLHRLGAPGAGRAA